MLLVGIIAISAVSAEQNINVDGVDFSLDDRLTITQENNDSTYFKLEEGIHGYIIEISESDIPDYIENNTEMGYSVSKIESSDLDEYAYIDSGIGSGYFVVFKKDNKNFVYLIESNDDINNNNEAIPKMGEMITDFMLVNDDLERI